jgi:hypothetical protein
VSEQEYLFMATAEGVTVPPVTEAGSGAAAGVDEVTVLVDGTSDKTIGDFVRILESRP